MIIFCGGSSCSQVFNLDPTDTSRDEEIANAVWQHFLTGHREGPIFLTHNLRQEDGGREQIGRLIRKMPFLRDTN